MEGEIGNDMGQVAEQQTSYQALLITPITTICGCFHYPITIEMSKENDYSTFRYRCHPSYENDSYGKLVVDKQIAS